MFAKLLRERLAGLVELGQPQVDLLETHFELLRRWNKVLNLTAIEDIEEAVERHYCEAIFVALHLPEGFLRIADVGSGGGFPGFPIGVMRPDCKVTLIESHQRKSVFLREVTRHLGGFRVLPVRAEEVTEEFDYITSRAVSYEDLGTGLKKLGRFADLLTGEKAPPEDLGFIWREAIALPWGKRRFLRLGERRE